MKANTCSTLSIIAVIIGFIAAIAALIFDRFHFIDAAGWFAVALILSLMALHKRGIKWTTIIKKVFLK